jgi:hypothetical protein
MSTFDGIVREYPFLCIDKFYLPGTTFPGSTAGHGGEFEIQSYLLSHIHTDHLVGLKQLCDEVKDWHKSTLPRIYLSEATARLLPEMRMIWSESKKLVLGPEETAEFDDLSLDGLDRLFQDFDYQDDTAEEDAVSFLQRFPRVEDMLYPLPMNEPVALPVYHIADIAIHLTVTLLSANHCSGAVMFFIEPDSDYYNSRDPSPYSSQETEPALPKRLELPSVVYTGDARLEKPHVDWLLRQGGPFHDKRDVQKVVETVYLDTTFACKQYSQFPTKAASIDAMCSALSLLSDTWREKQEDLHAHVLAHTSRIDSEAPGLVLRPLWIHVDCDIFGNEEIIVGLFRTFGKPVYLSPYRYGLYQIMLDGVASFKQAEYMCMDIPINFMDCITDDPRKTSIHSCAINDEWCPLCVQVGEEETDGIVDVRCSSYSWELFKVDSKKNTAIIREKMGRFLSLDGREMIPCVRFNEKPKPKFHPQPILHVLWAMHSAFEELLDFVQRVAPINLHPCVMHRGNADVEESDGLFLDEDKIKVSGMINLFQPVLRKRPVIERTPSPQHVFQFTALDTFCYVPSSPESSPFTSPRVVAPPIQKNPAPDPVRLRLSVTPCGESHPINLNSQSNSQNDHENVKPNSTRNSQDGYLEVKQPTSQGSVICLDTPECSPGKAVLVKATPGKSPLFQSPEVRAIREAWRNLVKTPIPLHAETQPTSEEITDGCETEDWIRLKDKRRKLNAPPTNLLDCTGP